MDVAALKSRTWRAELLKDAVFESGLLNCLVSVRLFFSTPLPLKLQGKNLFPTHGFSLNIRTGFSAKLLHFLGPLVSALAQNYSILQQKDPCS